MIVFHTIGGDIRLFTLAARGGAVGSRAPIRPGCTPRAIILLRAISLHSSGPSSTCCLRAATISLVRGLFNVRDRQSHRTDRAVQLYHNGIALREERRLRLLSSMRTLQLVMLHTYDGPSA